MGFLSALYLFILPIDKLAGLWYNGSSAPHRRGRRDAIPRRKSPPFRVGSWSAPEHHFLALGTQLGDELFSLRGGEVGHCVLDEHAILPVIVGILIDLNGVGLSAEGAVDFDNRISHGISSFPFLYLNYSTD